MSLGPLDIHEMLCMACMAEGAALEAQRVTRRHCVEARLAMNRARRCKEAASAYRAARAEAVNVLS